MKRIVFFDFEVASDGKIVDIGAIKSSGERFHSSIVNDFSKFISDSEYLCGHNILEHDIRFIEESVAKSHTLIDTLYLSPVLFPEKPYHKLVKDEKLLSEQLNNPLSDAQKAMELFHNEVDKFNSLSEKVKRGFYDLLGEDIHFKGFFDYCEFTSNRFSYLFNSKTDNISSILATEVCNKVNLSPIVRNNPVELAYAIAIISTKDRYSLTPKWVRYKFPQVDNIIHLLRGMNCHSKDCKYCQSHLESKGMLKRWFGYDNFRLFDGEPLQESAVNAAINGKSLLAIFPTGGGKSLTFQLPALIAGETSKGLTVVISPLQSLMKDQVENLEKRGIAESVYINGLLSPLERANAYERIVSGEVSLLYIAPEQLRSKTLEQVLLSRTINRFVIDEAHCFSAWGQDFRIEYLYIGEFLKDLQQKKRLSSPIPVSCFTATARPKVISDIIDYFEKSTGVTLEKFTSSATRTNLKYTVLYRESANDKYQTLRSLLQNKSCPSIVYVSRTAMAEELALKLSRDGMNAKPFHGKMETITKVQNQEDFIANKTDIIVATSAFGMGVDKSDVGLVIHYDISDSLENYLQEAGRAGRDVNTNADCYVLYNDNDINKHFILLNQTKLTFSEINQIWKAIKALTKNRDHIYISPLEVARKAGWEDVADIETKVKSAIMTLENGGYLKRGKNSPRIYATSIIPDSFDAAEKILDSQSVMTEQERVNCKRIFKSLISEKRRSIAQNAQPESRIDYLSDILGIETRNVIQSIEIMRNLGILSKDNDMTGYLRKNVGQSLSHFTNLERILLSKIEEDGPNIDLKEINEFAQESGVKKSKIKDFVTILFFWQIKHYIKKDLHQHSNDRVTVEFCDNVANIREKLEKRIDIARFLLDKFKEMENLSPERDYITINFSLAALLNKYNEEGLSTNSSEVSIDDVEEALLYLSKTGIVSIEGGFMVVYNKLELTRLAENSIRFKKEDYKHLDAFYTQRIQQIHIVSEFANMVVKDYFKALEFVKDYFHLEYRTFIRKYFDSEREKEISKNVSPAKYNEIFGSLTPTQHKIITDKESRFIVVPAGPGSGKTYLLVRKLASLILLEDVKSEKLLMLTFSRAAASEFKQRLFDLIGNAAKFVEIKTFHSYCFDILGQKGNLDKSSEIVKTATEGILSNSIEISKITKSILVIDEAQDMSKDEFALVEALIQKNEDIRIIAVGDDDQNIYEFRGSDSANIKEFIIKYNAVKYDMVENFRSSKAIISCANKFARNLSNRLKSTPIVPTLTSQGEVKFTLHNCDNFQQAIVNEILSKQYEGSIGILTHTNEEALIITALLNKVGKKARLIQSNNSFALYNLLELNAFTVYIRRKSQNIVSDQVWDDAKEFLEKEFKGSINLNIAQNCIKAFEKEYQTKYITDLENFIAESELSDFDEKEEKEIVISTIHKSKGREFDNVFVYFKAIKKLEEEQLRALYVAITRAKMTLSFHSNSDMQYYIGEDNQIFKSDPTIYDEPDQIAFQLTHKDVVLNYFKGKKEIILSLKAGDTLQPDLPYLTTSPNNGENPIKVLKFSEKFLGNLSRLTDKGYHISHTRIRYIVQWRYEESDGENKKFLKVPIILPEILLCK